MKTISMAIVLAILAWTISLNMTHAAPCYDFDSPDRVAHPRTLEEYHSMVPPEYDIFGACRSAEDWLSCLRLINGAECPTPGEEEE